MPAVSKQQPAGKKRATKRGILDKITDVETNDYLRLNVYGRSGTGKTTFWSSFPGPILVILTSGGSQPGELKSLGSDVRKKVKQFVLESTSEIPEVISYVRESGKYKTIVLDHVSSLSDIILKEILGLDEIPVQLTWGMATQEQYGQLGIKLKEILRSLLSVPSNVVLVAQEREFNTELDSDSLIMPFVASALTPSVVGWLNPAVDVIVQTFIRPKMVEKITKVGNKRVKKMVKSGDIEYCLRTGPDAVYTTKFRLPTDKKVPDVVVDPTYDKIMALIERA